MKKYLIILIACFMGILPLSAYASTFTAPMSASTFYGTVYYPGPNNGQTTTHVGGYSDHYYTFTNFNLTGSPTTGISSAILYYNATSTNTTSPLPLIYRITSSWAESTLTRTNAPTYNSGTSYSFSPTWTDATGWKTVDITTLYNQWVGGTYTNYGVTLRDTVNSPNSDTQVSSYDGSYNPYILVTYTTGGATATTTPDLSVQGTLSVQGKLQVQ